MFLAILLTTTTPATLHTRQHNAYISFSKKWLIKIVNFQSEILFNEYLSETCVNQFFFFLSFYMQDSEWVDWGRWAWAWNMIKFYNWFMYCIELYFVFISEMFILCGQKKTIFFVNTFPSQHRRSCGCYYFYCIRCYSILLCYFFSFHTSFFLLFCCFSL